MLVRKPARQVLFILLAAALTLTSCNLGGGTPAPAVDINAINTAAFATALGQLSAQQTQTALAAPSATASPTNTTSAPAASIVAPPADGTLPTVSFNNAANTTPLAAFTPLGSPIAPAATLSFASGCNNAAFEADVTIPDGSVIDPGVNFEKIWKIRNTGTCKWDEGYSFVYIGGSTPDLDPYDYKFSKTSGKDFVAAGEAIDIALTLTTPCKPGKYEGHWKMRDDQGNFFGTPISVYVEVTGTKKKC